MAELPSGTVTLLFSDIEGSTLLLRRLGEAYAEALDRHRHILRNAWSAFGGTEMGTEGDSFFVVFRTAEHAVAAAAQAQRGLAEAAWPEGERVKVRVGIHTGSPTLHHDAYVGLDVHRAARIAGAAHGGQVVVSSDTAQLVDSRLPGSTRLRDLGLHRLKDIGREERLFQLTIDGLPSEFGPLKTLGASSSLPRPATPLVGRADELAELTALLSSPQVRLVTLTGPGGSGKTRLAISLAQQLVEASPDGVYFVPLASATTAAATWTSIAEVLNVPPQGRELPGFFAHLEHRAALFVLDNLEQLPSADEVVARLLEEAPHLVVIATSRRPLHVAGEHEHPVPPLDLPEDSAHIDLGIARASGAVQMFVDHARMVRPDFAITGDNAAEVAAICRRLDGLPLAIELVAARCKLLSPRALVRRLDQPLDIAAAVKERPGRQQSLRSAIAWSHDLLAPHQQVFFRRLSVFAGSADLDAVASVAAGEGDGADVWEWIAGLADASLVTVSEDDLGEPRVAMLETIRTFARDQLEQAGELDEVCHAHAQHYLTILGELHAKHATGIGDRVLEATRRFEIEHDNLRAALSWALTSRNEGAAQPYRSRVGLQLCAEAGRLWFQVGYLTEGQQWLESAIAAAGDEDSPELARCLCWLAGIRAMTGDLESEDELSLRALAMSRRLDDPKDAVSALLFQGHVAHRRDQPEEARRNVEEAVDLARDSDDGPKLAESLVDLARLEESAGNLELALEILTEASAIDQRRGAEYDVMYDRLAMAPILRGLGRSAQAYDLLTELAPALLRLGEPEFVVVLAEELCIVLAELDRPADAVRLAASTTAARTRDGTIRSARHQSEIERLLETTRAILDPVTWAQCYESGAELPVEDALTTGARQWAGD